MAGENLGCEEDKIIGISRIVVNISGGIMNKFKVGNVVQVKSSEIWMTVSEIRDVGVYCLWFDGGDLKRGFFETDTLNLVKE